MLDLTGTDKVHDHLTLGFRRGCVACAQLEADMARAKRSVSERVGRRFSETHAGAGAVQKR